MLISTVSRALPEKQCGLDSALSWSILVHKDYIYQAQHKSGNLPTVAIVVLSFDGDWITFM